MAPNAIKQEAFPFSRILQMSPCETTGKSDSLVTPHQLQLLPENVVGRFHSYSFGQRLEDPEIYKESVLAKRHFHGKSISRNMIARASKPFN